MDIQKVSLFSDYCPHFKENRTIPIYYYEELGKLTGRKYINYEPCCDDCPLSHNVFEQEECCPIYNNQINSQ